MKQAKTSRVTIDIYDKTGNIRAGSLRNVNFDELRKEMIIALEHDYIPVVRQLGKHEAVEENTKKDETPFALDALKGVEKACAEAMGFVNSAGNKTKLPETIPMVLEYEFDGIKFHAAGHPLDVHCANEALLKRVFEEGKENG